jgi:hypothetical protein
MMMSLKFSNTRIPGSSDPHLGDGVGDDQISFSVGPDDVHADPGRSLRKHGAALWKADNGKIAPFA